MINARHVFMCVGFPQIVTSTPEKYLSEAEENIINYVETTSIQVWSFGKSLLDHRHMLRY
jgi:hypothetical protein